jgi:hypothetical protein
MYTVLNASLKSECWNGEHELLSCTVYFQMCVVASYFLPILNLASDWILLASLRVPGTLVPLSPATNLFKQNLKIFRGLSDSVVPFSPTLMEICLLNYLESSCCTDSETFCF